MATVRRSLSLSLLPALGCALAACRAPGVEPYFEPDAGHGLEAAMDEDAGTDGPVVAASSVVLGAIGEQAYELAPLFVQASDRFQSSAVPGAFVTEWVSSYAFDAYSRISPASTSAPSGSPVTLPVGTILVRAVGDEDGGIEELTLLFKGPPGSNPVLGDWLFGVTTPDGTPVASPDGGGPEIGQLTQCYGCHQMRAASDFLFGVPAPDRTPAP